MTTESLVKGKRILLVDDEPGIRAVLRKVLDRAGAEVRDVGGGMEAVVEIGNGHFDAIFMDLNMPEFSGEDSIKAIIQHNPKAVIIVYSGFEDPGAKDRVKELGVAAVLEKPASATLILHTLNSVLADRAGDQA